MSSARDPVDAEGVIDPGVHKGRVAALHGEALTLQLLATAGVPVYHTGAALFQWPKLGDAIRAACNCLSLGFVIRDEISCQGTNMGENMSSARTRVCRIARRDVC